MVENMDEQTRRLESSDKEAFSRLYLHYYPLLINYAGLMVSREAAEDIVQDVFVKVWKNKNNLIINNLTVGGG